MFYGDTIEDTRAVFFSSWEKYKQKKLLTPLEEEVVQVILAHPEYHLILEQKEKAQQHTYYPELGETNPFLHMGLHLGIREQIATNRPEGIQVVYNALIKKVGDPMRVEHLMMEQLAECLWLAQKNNQPPDEHYYLHALAKQADL